MARKKTYNTVSDIQTLETFDELKKRLFKEKKIEVQNFGILTLKTMRARRAYVPGTNGYEEFPEYLKMTFEPTGTFKKKLQKFSTGK